MASSPPEQKLLERARDAESLIDSPGGRCIVNQNGALYGNIPANFANHMDVSEGDCVRISYSQPGPVVIEEEAIIIRRVEDE